MRINMRSDGLVNHTEEVLGRHVGCYFAAGAVATTVETMHIATERGLPKQLLQRMQLLEILATQAFEFEDEAFAEVHVEQGFTTKLRDYISTMPTIW
jgi:hypothetical protein